MYLFSNQFSGIVKETYCFYHPKELLIELCINKECAQPLCAKCTQIHIEHHRAMDTKYNIKDLKSCHQESFASMVKFANSIFDYGEFIQDQIQLIKQTKLSYDPIEGIDELQQSVELQIRTYFATLRSEVIAQCPQLQKLQNLKAIMLELEHRWGQLMEEIQALETRGAIRELIHFYSGDVQRVNNHYFRKAEEYLQSVSEIEWQELNVPTLSIKAHNLQDLCNFLTQLVSVQQEWGIVTKPLDYAEPNEEPIEQLTEGLETPHQLIENFADEQIVPELEKSTEDQNYYQFN